MVLDHESAVRSVSDLTGVIAAGAGVMIDTAISQGKRLPVTTLSEELGKNLGVDKVVCYHIVTMYMRTRGDLRIKMGPKGGIERIPVEAQK